MGLKIRVESPKVKYTEDFIEAQYEYETTNVTEDDNMQYTVSIPECSFFPFSILFFLLLKFPSSSVTYVALYKISKQIIFHIFYI